MSVLMRVLVCCFCFVCMPVYAGAFKVFPLKLNFDAKTQTILFRINNTGNDDVTVQLSASVWAQDATGDDVYAETDDIVFFPKIVDIKQGEERVVRVAYRGSHGSAQEKSFRLFAQELPKKSEASGALSFALRFSVPVFVGTKSQSPAVEIVSIEHKNGEVQLRVANRGNQHFVVSKIDVNGISSSNSVLFSTHGKGWYVLPGAQRVFSVSLDEESCKASVKLNTILSVGNKKSSASVAVDPSQCRKKVFANKKVNSFQ